MKTNKPSKHCLHLCDNSNMDELVFSCLLDADVFVTNNNKFWEEKFKEKNINCKIKTPIIVKPEEKIVVDGSSLGKKFEKWENKWEKQNKTICIYNLNQLDSSILKDLVSLHKEMSLSVNKIRMISNKTIEKEMEDISHDVVENTVKRELKTIILSLLLSEPMSGTEIVKILYQKFKVFVSPGMLYPVLHELEKNEFLKYEYKLKNKVYTIQKKEQTEDLLKKHAKANSLISQFLVSD